MKHRLLCAVLVMHVAFCCTAVFGQQRYPVRGLVLGVDRAHLTMMVSCDEIRGYMDAMVMPIKVRDVKSLDGLARGALVEFSLVVSKEDSYADQVKVRSYASAEREPSKSRRLETFEQALSGVGTKRIPVGQAVPDFSLIDQKTRPVHLAQFAGKVVALNFVYTRCALPDYCFRLSNNFGVLQSATKIASGATWSCLP